MYRNVGMQFLAFSDVQALALFAQSNMKIFTKFTLRMKQMNEQT